MDERSGRVERRSSVRPVFLYPFLGFMALAHGWIAVRAVLEQDWRHVGFVAGLGCIGFFFYRNPALLNGPPWMPPEEFAEAADMEFLWLGLALMFASRVVF